MDREILFRGKVTGLPLYLQDKEKLGTWVYGSYLSYPTAQIVGLEDEYIVDPDTVGQFTGLCDRDGKKIFEGDIVKMVPDDNEEESWITEVKFEDGAFRVEVNGCDYTYTAIGWIDDDVETEVIGNIHDNPELLKEESE